MMKKILLGALTAALLLSLTACSQLLNEVAKEPERPTGPVYTQGDETQPTGADTPSDTPSEKPTEPAKPEMLGYDANGFSVWPEGNYLANPKFDTDEYLPDFDVDNGMCAPEFSATVCSTPETVYAAPCDFIPGVGIYTFMAFADKATGIVAPLCGRPECSHDDEDCNAYMGAYAYGLRVYDGKLWWVTDVMFKEEPELRCMELDGTNRETVATLEKGFETVEYMLHRGYVYTSQIVSSVLDGKPAFAFRVVAYSMDDGHMITILDQVHEGKANVGGARFLTVLPVGNDLYILLSWEGEQEGGETVHSTQIYRWSSKTRKAEQLYSAENGEWDYLATYPYGRAYPAREEGLYYITCTKTDDPNAPPEILGDYVGDGTRTDYTLMLFSFKTGEFEEVSSFSVFNGDTLWITRDYIGVYGSYQDGLLRVLIYDYGGNLLSVSEPIFDYTITGSSKAGGDEDYFYIQYGLNSETGIEPGILAVPVHGGELLDINNTGEPQL